MTTSPTMILTIGLALALSASIGYGIGTSAQDYPFFEPFDSDEDMWSNIIAAYPNYDAMSDLQKTTALRTWASQHMYVSGNVNVYDHQKFDNRHPYRIFNHFSTFHNGNAGVMCSGYAHALCVLYAYAGFPALKYDYGGDGCSHSVTLVRIMDDGEPKIIVQDAYFDYYYAWPDGTAMSVYEAFDEVRANRYDNIVPVYERSMDYLVATPLSEEAIRVFGVECIKKIDHDSVIYRYWYTPENYLTSPAYLSARRTVYGNDATDLDLLVEKRLIFSFDSNYDRPLLFEDFSFLETLS